LQVWRDGWTASDAWIGEIQRSLASEGLVVQSGGDFDRWDLELRGGLGGSARIFHTVEEYGHGQIGRFRVWPTWSVTMLLVVVVLAFLGGAAILVSAYIAGTALILGAIVLALKSALDCGSATEALARACLAAGSPL
jgi:hypothetical protein